MACSEKHMRCTIAKTTMRILYLQYKTITITKALTKMRTSYTHKSIYSKILLDFYFHIGCSRLSLSLSVFFSPNQWFCLKYGIEWAPFRAYNHRYRVYGSIYWSDILFSSIFCSLSLSLPYLCLSSSRNTMMKGAFRCA